MSKPLTLEQLRKMDGEKVLFKPSWFESAEVFTVRLTNNLWHGCIVNGEGLYIELEAAAERGVYAYPPAHIDREAWKPCDECKPSCMGCVKSYGWDRYGKAQACDTCEDYSNFEPDDKYCANCGRPLTEEAWQELEKRVRGEK